MADSLIDPVEIVPFSRSDLAEVTAIDAASDLAPWSSALFESSLQAGHLGFKAVCGEQAVGYALLQIVQDEAELLKIAVLTDFRRAGVGQALLDRVIAAATRSGCQRLLLEVRISNRAAIALYQRSGFTPVGQRRDYYSALPGSQQREDALLMAISCADQP